MTLKLHFNFKKKTRKRSLQKNNNDEVFYLVCRNAKKHNKHTGGVYLHNVQFVTVYFSKDNNTLVFSVFVSGVRALT